MSRERRRSARPAGASPDAAAPRVAARRARHRRWLLLQRILWVALFLGALAYGTWYVRSHAKPSATGPAPQAEPSLIQSLPAPAWEHAHMGVAYGDGNHHE